MARDRRGRSFAARIQAGQYAQVVAEYKKSEEKFRKMRARR